MGGLRWEEWGIGLVGVWLVATPCALGLSPSEDLWNLGFTANMLLAGGALAVLGVRALSEPRLVEQASSPSRMLVPRLPH